MFSCLRWTSRSYREKHSIKNRTDQRIKGWLMFNHWTHLQTLLKLFDIHCLREGTRNSTPYTEVTLIKSKSPLLSNRWRVPSYRTSSRQCSLLVRIEKRENIPEYVTALPPHATNFSRNKHGTRDNIYYFHCSLTGFACFRPPLDVICSFIT